LDAKEESELDEIFHDALLLDENYIKPEEVDIKLEEVDIIKEEVDIIKEEVDIKSEKVDNIPEEVDNKLEEVDYKPAKRKNTKEVNLKEKKKVYLVEKCIEKGVRNSSKLLSKSSYKMCIYFNKDCYPGGHIVKKKISSLPDCIGPGPVSSILQDGITTFVDLDYSPPTTLKKIKQIQNKLFSGPGGVEIWITTMYVFNLCSHYNNN